jgi:DNA-binding NarL/FixJ family response regulator
MDQLSIVLADDHVMFRQGIRSFLESLDGITIVGEATDGLELLEILKTTIIDVAILDIVMPNMHGMEVMHEIHQKYPQIKVLFLTMHGKLEYIRQALAYGVHGFILKEEPRSELVKAVEAIREGKKYFSPLLATTLSSMIINKDETTFLSRREREILKCLTSGMTSQEIASHLFISINTVRRHRQNIMQKLDIHSQTELIRYAISQGYSE